jgi:acetolactate synthase-1/2/3 large subunit/5-guanidino-2-oxopentanoate decarboxylase
MSTNGAAVSQYLKNCGVEVIFGIPGVHNQELYRGIEDAGIRHVLARHEQGAGFMADGYARASGRPGVAYVISGPGLCNIMTPIGQAYSDSVPMLVIASSLNDNNAQHGQLHQMKDQLGAGAAVADWAKRANDSEDLFDLVKTAFEEFATKRARPKYIEAPIALLEASMGDLPDLPQAQQRPHPSMPLVEKMADAIASANTPLFIFGGGAKNASVEAEDLMRLSNAAAFTTYAGRGVLGADHPMNFGAYLARPSSADIAAKADLVIVFGSELGEVDLWRPHLGHTCPMMRVDIDPDVFNDPQHPAELTICADVDATLRALCDELSKRAEHATNWQDMHIRELRVKWLTEVKQERPSIPEVCDVLRAAIPVDTMIYSDMTQFAYAAKEVWDMEFPGHWHHPTGFGTLGYALPAAIGGAVSRGLRPTMAIAGDYGFQYTLPELAVAVELGLSLPIIVWDNSKLGEIEASMVRSQIAPNAVDVRNPDFLALAEAYGALAKAPQTLDELAVVVAQAFDAGRPTLIRVTADITSSSQGS